MPLTDAEIRALKPGERPFKRYDEHGLFIEVPPFGALRWRFRYKFAGKAKLMSLGTYPAVRLKAARTARDDARDLLRKGIDPSTRRQAEKRAQARAGQRSVEAVAREWFEAVHQKAVVATHSGRNLRRLERYVFPKIGRRAIGEIEPSDVLALLRGIEKAGKLETGHRVKTLLGHVFRYGIATGRAKRDPTADLKGLLASAETRHHPAVTDPSELPGLLRAIDGYTGYPPTVAALKLSALLFVRPGEMRTMEWASLRLDAAEWNYRPSKGGIPLLVPLPTQAVEILRELQPLTGLGTYVFPSARGRGRPMSENTVNAALHRMGYKDQMSAHGFRAMARTILVERLGWDERYVEMQLGHAVRDANGRAYNRVTFLDQRREMLQSWADYLDGLRDPAANVVPIRAGSAAAVR
ncbi:tyrosine-type recombinase/integrase [Thioalkalivibrio paradoxus]|uniref:Integrase n=1 Tax=Thioalkalivibrio paradoxus ARh 1 TaxID=713585 RepID=W0DIY0_9GAMM|nr:integrase arm-type DNA-binding domain-containing protein [Thioalkalivibrio paradoxus]AHE97177.1 integrase [Thioalkalivibrio paradoxus ARh 1]